MDRVVHRGRAVADVYVLASFADTGGHLRARCLYSQRGQRQKDGGQGSIVSSGSASVVAAVLPLLTAVLPCSSIDTACKEAQAVKEESSDASRSRRCRRRKHPSNPSHLSATSTGVRTTIRQASPRTSSTRADDALQRFSLKVIASTTRNTSVIRRRGPSATTEMACLETGVATHLLPCQRTSTGSGALVPPSTAKSGFGSLGIRNCSQFDESTSERQQ